MKRIFVLMISVLALFSFSCSNTTSNKKVLIEEALKDAQLDYRECRVNKPKVIKVFIVKREGLIDIKCGDKCITYRCYPWGNDDALCVSQAEK